VQSLVDFRNEISHDSNGITQVQFNALVKKCKDALIALGESEESFERILTDSPPATASRAAVPVDSASAVKLKEEGNALFKQKKYNEAICVYTNCLEEEFALSAEFRSAILANRAGCRINLKEYDSAVADAKLAILYNPMWFRGYQRLGKARLGQAKPNSAPKAVSGTKNCISTLRLAIANLLQSAYSQAIALNPTNSALESEMGEAQFALEKFNRKEHLLPNYSRTIPLSETLAKLSAQSGMKLKSVADLENFNSLLRSSKSPILQSEADYREAKLYQFGQGGRPRDLKKAAEYYRNSANAGNPQSMYELVRTTELVAIIQTCTNQYY